MMIETTTAVGKIHLLDVIRLTYESLEPFVAEKFEIKEVLFSGYATGRPDEIWVTVGSRKPLRAAELFRVTLPMPEAAMCDIPSFMSLLLRRLAICIPDDLRACCSDVFDKWAVPAGKLSRAELLARRDSVNRTSTVNPNPGT